MDINALKELFADFGDFESLIEKIVPDLSKVLGWAELIVRLAIMAGPLLLLGTGLLYLLAPPKEANYSAGYRCYWGMSSLAAWRFTQKVAGIGWTLLGLVLTVVMGVLGVGLQGMEPMDMVWTAVKYLIWQGGLVLVSRVIIGVIIFACFDRAGFPRREYYE